MSAPGLKSIHKSMMYIQEMLSTITKTNEKIVLVKTRNILSFIWYAVMKNAEDILSKRNKKIRLFS